MLSASLSGWVVLDRIAVIVDKHVIKVSDIERDVRLTEFLNSEALQLTPAAKRQAAERLTDQEIIRQEITGGGYEQPAESDALTLLNQIRKDRFGGSESRVEQALAHYGLSEGELLGRLLWQLTVLRFIDQRFRVGVLVTDQEVSTYYDQHLTELRRQYPGDSSLPALTPKIRSTLEEERINQNFNAWLDQACKLAAIEYKQGAFE
jgi:peptidyl-prolyl cis-trans isomerase SurA